VELRNSGPISTHFTLVLVFGVANCLKNLEMSGNYTDVREMSRISVIVGELLGENLVMENCTKAFF